MFGYWNSKGNGSHGAGSNCVIIRSVPWNWARPHVSNKSEDRKNVVR